MTPKRTVFALIDDPWGEENMKFLYITENGEAFVHNEPTPLDIQAVEDGVLTIFRFVNNQFEEYNPTADDSKPFEPVPAGVLITQNNQACHVPVRSRPCCTATSLPFHSCPYQEDVHNNPDPEYCNCCPECEEQCRQDI